MHRLLAVSLLLLVAVPASAHVSGAHLPRADFDHPAKLSMVPLDGGGFLYSYVPEEADQKYTVSWVDGDVDPTARFTFYYLDHMPNDAVSYDQLERTSARR